ncbi:GPI transamidase component PIG-S-like isoform X1 [Littorina saxatilis]|uniref:GPI transamidase component PIG-S-like isoform X1 n=1 Tax=Littorina saxatilis TaxID=31220 RepID=UPI0038B4A39D
MAGEDEKGSKSKNVPVFRFWEKFTQTYAALGIGLVCILIGVPLWWKTTEIYRVQLPYADIHRLAETKIQYSVEIEVISFNSKLTKSLPDIAKSLQTSLTREKRSSVQPVYQVRVRDANNKETSLWKKSKTLDDLDEAFWELTKLRHSKYTILFLPESSNLRARPQYVGRFGNVIVTVSKEGITDMLQQLVPTIQEVLVREGAVEKSLDAAQGLRTQKPDKESMRWFRSNPGYDVTFTLVNPQPDVLDVQWNIQAGIEGYLKPFLDKLANFSDISVASQVLHYVGLVASPKKDSSEKFHFYTEQDLPRMINPLEAKLGSHASNNPTLNFVVYVPGKASSPVYIRDQNGERVASNSFLSPRWGGILIYNAEARSKAAGPTTVDIDIKHIMEVFLTQMRLLLNIHVQTPNQQVSFAELGKEAITEWELSGWLRCRCVENLATAKASLQSLAQLLDQIVNIVINDDIGREVEDAVRSIEHSEELLAGGHLHDAFIESRNAIVASEKAFFDQSLLELLYFPEDQKFAIYIPLFLPISIPVLTSIVQAVKWLKQHRREKLKSQ